MRFFILLTVAIIASAFAPIKQTLSNADRHTDVDQLAKVRLYRARNCYDAVWDDFQPFQIGKSDPEKVYRWSRRWMEAELSTVQSKTDRIAATQSHLERMKSLELKVRGDGARSTIPVYELPATQYYCAEAEIQSE